MPAWSDQGCAVCRRQWEIGQPPPEIAVNLALHSSLHRCPTCQAYWEQTERFAHVIDPTEAKRLYPEAFVRGEAA